MKTKKILGCSVDELGLSKRMRNRLMGARIETVRQLVSFTKDELLAYRYFGPALVAELEDALSRHELTLKS